MTIGGWFVVGIVLLTLFAMYAPRLAGVFVILLVTALTVEAGRKQLI